MRQITINRTECKASELCLGTADIGTPKLMDYVPLLNLFTESGGNFLDTARVYSNWYPGVKGRSEKLLGKWMQERKNRHQLIIASKGAHHKLDSFDQKRVNPEAIISDLEASLKDLKTDYIDIYYLHRDDPSVEITPLLSCLENMVKQGKIRYYACSNWSAKRMSEALQISRKMGWKGFVCNQPLWNIGSDFMQQLDDPTVPKMDSQLFQLHQQENICCCPYSAQANGYFSKYLSQSKTARDSASASVYDTEKNRKRAEEIRKMSKEFNVSPIALSLYYLQAAPFPVIPLIGANSLERLQEAISAMDTREIPLNQLKNFYPVS